MSTDKNTHDSESGSVIFIILVGVILFAALSFTVSSIMRSGNLNMIPEEKAKLYAGEILEYGRNIRQAVQNMRINGCEPLDISFANSIVSGYAHTPAASTTCQVFHADGGGINYIVPSDDWLDPNQNSEALYEEWYFPSRVCVPDIGTGSSLCWNDSLDNEELMVILPYVKEEVCLQINNTLGNSSIPTEADNGWHSANTKFNGILTEARALNQSMVGCFEGSAANTPPENTFHFYQVLVPR